MQKAAEDLRSEAKAKAEEKERYINERVAPLKAEGLGQGNFWYINDCNRSEYELAVFCLVDRNCDRRKT